MEKTNARVVNSSVAIARCWTARAMQVMLVMLNIRTCTTVMSLSLQLAPRNERKKGVVTEIL